MALAAGTRLGPYQVVAIIGAGGMGEVYRARDLRLGRDVAMKRLPDLWAGDEERVARFEREAQILASLNHPHIAAIYGIEEADGSKLLVLELVDGVTLADRLSRGPLPLTEALTIARQVADALEAAQEKQIIHRDLKPANIALTATDQVKVLDFGLGKTIESNQPGDPSNLSTLAGAGTKAGVILGTPSYMSPEQTRGRLLDKRTDIWAFGCVLYEMLTGRLAFPGETRSDTVAAILGREPDWNALPASTPARVQWLLRRCLEKDPTRRLHDIADARIELDEALKEPASIVRSPTSLREPVAWVVAGLSLAALIVALALRSGGSSTSSNVISRAYRSSILLPEGAQPTSPEGIRPTTVRASGRFALSPDGKRLALVAQDQTGKTLLWIRALDTGVAQPLAGTDSAAYPFWSPDSRFVAFHSQGKLKRIDASGGPISTLCDAVENATGAWGRDDVILFMPKGGAPLYRVSALGGTPTPVTTLDTASGDAQHWFPFFLPDGRHFLYFVMGSKTAGAISPRGVYVGSLDPNEPRKLVLDVGSNAKYADAHLIFLRGRTLMAQPFDTERLEVHGEAVPLAEQVQIDGDTGWAGGFSVAETGALVYQTGLDVIRSQLTWLDRSGKQTSLLGDQADYSDVTLSPDGRQVAVGILDPATNSRDLWLYDVARGLRTRFTSEVWDDVSPVWSSDLSRLIFASGRKGGYDVYQKPLNGTAAESEVLKENLGEFPGSLSADGRFLLYVFGSGTMRRSDLWVLPLFGDRKPFPFVDTSFIETQGRFSPDGQWIAYVSNESGQSEVYVAPFQRPGARSRVSPAGGNWPRWRRDGKEIFYLAPGNALTSATVSSQGTDFSVGAVRPLFTVRLRPLVRLDAYDYDVSSDGQRFLMNRFVEESASTAITLMVNWTAGLGR